MSSRDKLPVSLLSVLILVCVVTAWNPPSGRLNWALEVVPGLLEVIGFAIVYRRFRFANVVYIGMLIHMFILIYGGYWSYANTPLGNWAKEAFHLSRNHYDRIGHLALGFFPMMTTREILIRVSPAKVGRWLYFFSLSIVFSIGAFWELIEWWTTLLVAGDVGSAFLGSQGDVWDAQWDMFLVGVGAAISPFVFGRRHDAEIRQELEHANPNQ